MKRCKKLIGLLLIASMSVSPFSGLQAMAKAEKSSTAPSIQEQFAERRTLYDNMSTLTGIPWYVLAAVDQYERTISIANPKKRPLRDGLISIHIPNNKWAGELNPDEIDTEPKSIAFFDGFGKDGNGDGKADPKDDTDLLYSMASYLQEYGTAPDDTNIALWEFYKNARSVERIEQFARLYSHFNTLDLHKHTFVMPLRADYSYRSTWGAARSYGGYRIHEGTDLFASYGVPVRSVCYGIIEVMGWNRYGGWRVGIRDLNNVYHYYAHLSGFNKKEVKEGDIVVPGQVIGWVGSSGYGKPGTSGKFPPHLHYGLYRDNGFTEWSFDPYPYLRRWEREERISLSKKKKK
ncbi:M23 family metallopeptidase [Paenibacillus turpanensis]|uniref:M23 family metallopeptidase n=1 Tax=Paenibacillus turpanensis TaxID=2689078 RepID=UPI00140D138A|nr:M23 family metallopeptidase [Paenibacillus turpanensis]